MKIGWERLDEDRMGEVGREWMDVYLRRRGNCGGLRICGGGERKGGPEGFH